MLAAIRPGSWNLVLFLHVAGAIALVATLVVATFAIVNAARRGDRTATRFAFRSLYLGVLPALIVMRVGAQLIVDEEQLGDSPEAWLGIGFGVADGSMVLLLVTILMTGLAARRSAPGPGRPGAGLLRAATVLTGLMIAANIVAIYAMTAKPS